MTETSIISFAPIRQRRFLAQSSSDPERPRQASDVAQVEAIAAERERRLTEQGEAMISGMGTMMTTEMNVAQRHIHELQEQEQATIMTSGLQIRRPAAHVQHDQALAEAAVHSVQMSAQANVSELHTLAV
jgi:hypothetical protein